ncbi:hypothetical protein ACLOJK_017620 [Asimina triloba]
MIDGRSRFGIKRRAALDRKFWRLGLWIDPDRWSSKSRKGRGTEEDTTPVNLAMARVSSSKHNRDQALTFHISCGKNIVHFEPFVNRHECERLTLADPDFQDFLTDLQDWEHSLKEKDKKLKGHLQEEKKMVSSSGKVDFPNEGRAPMPRVNKPIYETNAKVSRGSNHERQQFDYLRSLDAINHLSGNLMTEEGTPDAASEKELGNEYYKQKKFHKAIECYSRSIALSPSSVAFANRAMAYIKVKKFEEAEDDCTEALNLDDRYVKAYSRRATARKELGNFKLSMEDSEFALRLEPNNQELQKLYSEVKELYEKEIVKKTSIAFENAVQRMDSIRKSETETKGHCLRPQITAVEAEHIKFGTWSSLNLGKSQDEAKDNIASLVLSVFMQDNIREVGGQPALITEEKDSVTTTYSNKSRDQQSDASQIVPTPSSGKENSTIKNVVDGKLKVMASVQELASRAASQALAAAAKNITAPKSAYQFEVSWRALSDDPLLQAHLLKLLKPTTFPWTDYFYPSLSPRVEETQLSIEILDSLTKVARFDMIIMCLSNNDKAGLKSKPLELLDVLVGMDWHLCETEFYFLFFSPSPDLSGIWDEVFSNEAILAMAGHAETMRRLRPRYCPGSGILIFD